MRHSFGANSTDSLASSSYCLVALSHCVSFIMVAHTILFIANNGDSNVVSSKYHIL
jgi:hypothetical protein